MRDLFIVVTMVTSPITRESSNSIPTLRESMDLSQVHVLWCPLTRSRLVSLSGMTGYRNLVRSARPAVGVSGFVKYLKSRPSKSQHDLRDSLNRWW
jgi:hypothetical protein